MQADVPSAFKNLGKSPDLQTGLAEVEQQAEPHRAYHPEPATNDIPLIPTAESPDSSRDGHAFDNSGFCHAAESRDFRPLVLPLVSG